MKSRQFFAYHFNQSLAVGISKLSGVLFNLKRAVFINDLAYDVSRGCAREMNSTQRFYGDIISKLLSCQVVIYEFEKFLGLNRLGKIRICTD